ncbi:CHY zinc finger protein [Alicyclobacillus fodiniaquatilis]|uniref:CHY zinc finger protein n=1 Tax=Alicyclobacillus fodiniaquatilis TaxID=1661150 RepID=A0ABW4JKV4_9BACL
MKINGFEVNGVEVDANTGCQHYRSALDIIAIKFPCCQTYYPCFQCHAETADHKAEVWPRARWKEKAILCGACKSELTIEQYLQSQAICPNCGAQFNPGCSLHHHLYFEV